MGLQNRDVCLHQENCVGHEVVEMVERLCSSMNKDQTQDLLFEIILPTYE